MMTSDLTECTNSCLLKTKIVCVWERGEEGCGKYHSLGLSAPWMDAVHCLEPAPKPSAHPSQSQKAG